MTTLKTRLFAFLTLLVLCLIGTYFYFSQKFTPEPNYLSIQNESGNIPFTWLGEDKNVLLLPVHFSGDTTTYYLQFDTGSPSTVFYSKAINKIGQITVKGEKAEATFYIGKAQITSDKFQVLNFGEEDNRNIKIIGTIGADILDSRKTILNFKENYIAFNLSKEPVQFQGKSFGFKFKKRKIIIQGLLNGNEEKLVFDTGTSAYELLTNKEVWENLKLPNSKVTIEKSQSWDKILTSYTAKCKQNIQFGSKTIPLNNVTYIEGFSQTQYAMMKFSGITGMLGNKIFLNNSLYIDCLENKIGIE
ncbi:hypothetical protein LAG90_02330 [Marinilongibacter aquaticus]|uniref:hypothetical protein n=1 Tax=Marinilongibacter aquaticus TaxID=2975157 RepID=UPI0021BDEC69|nr:hypothetical protein [Marinilongibacter aquaticus]UBM59493.1 hypothetical protein LAG90_02330 [Marinilongibacter aquaticus]